MQMDGIRTRHFRIGTKIGFHQGPLLNGALWALMPLHYRPLRYKNRREHRRFQKGPRRMTEFGEGNICYSKVGQVSVRKGLSIIDNGNMNYFLEQDPQPS